MDFAELLMIVLKASILLTVLSLGLNATWDDALHLFRRPSLLVRSVVSMNVAMPLVACALVVATDMPVPVRVALAALAVSPVPPILPKKQVKAGGDASYAIGLLAGIAVLAIIVVPVTVPAIANAFDRTAQVSPLQVAKVVVASVLAPLALGIVVRAWRPSIADRLAAPIARVGMVLLIGGAAVLLYASWPAIRVLIGNGTVLVIAVMVVCGLAIGHLMGGPEADDRTVLALSTATRHPAMALAIGVAAGEESRQETGAILLYFIVAIIVSIPYVAWRRRLASRAPVSMSSTTSWK